MGGWMSHSHLAGPTLRFRGDPELHWGLGRGQSAGPGDPDSLGGAWAVPPGGRYLLPPPHLTRWWWGSDSPADAFVRWKARRVTVRAFQPNRREFPVV